VPSSSRRGNTGGFSLVGFQAAGQGEGMAVKHGERTSAFRRGAGGITIENRHF
jgi:hypothetical protein